MMTSFIFRLTIPLNSKIHMLEKLKKLQYVINAYNLSHSMKLRLPG